MQTKEQYQWVDILRAIGALSVILLHSTVSLVSKFDLTTDWWIAHVLNSFTRFAVPIFLMISGVLLLGRKYTIKDFLKKRLVRILLPFLLWSIIYFLWKNSFSGNFVSYGTEFFKQMKNGMQFHLWYVYMILGVYLIIPIVNTWIKNACNNEILYYLIIWFVVVLLGFPYFNKLYSRIDLRYFSGFLGYVILGYYLLNLKKEFPKIVLFLVFIVSSLGTVMLSYYDSLPIGRFSGLYYDYLSPNVILTAASLFLLLKGFTVKQKYISKVIYIASKYSYGIYLSHIFAFLLMSKYNLRINCGILFIDLIMQTAICFLISLAITFTINKLPFGKYISG